MASGIELANAYVALTVKAPNIKRDIESEIGKADVDNEGKKLGQRTGKGFSAGMAAVAGAVGGAVASVVDRAMSSMGDLWSEASAMSDGLQKFKSTLEFAGLDTKNIDRLAKSTRKYADQTVYDLTDIQNITAQLASNGVKDYDKLAEASGNLNAIAGGNSETFKSVGMVLTQTAGQGKLTAENWNQLSDAIPGASGKIQEALSKNGAFVGNFRDAMSKGEITAQEFNDALLQLGNEPVAVEAAKSTETLEGAFGNLKANVVGAMSDMLNDVKPMLTDLIGAVADGFQGAVQGVKDTVAWVQDNMTWIGPVATGLAVVAGGFAAIGAASTVAAAGGLAKWLATTKIATGIQAAFNMVMNANPIMLIVTAIGALVAGLVYFFTQTELGKSVWEEFTRFLGEAWANITGFFTAAWENVIQPIFQAIGDIAVWLYENAIKPAFDGIISAVQFVGGVVKFIGDLVVNYFRFWGAVGTWLYEKAIKPALDGIGAAFNWVWLNVIKPVTDGIAAAFNWLWANVISPVIDYINSKIQGLGMMFDWLYKNIIQPVWKGIESVLRAGWTWIDANVFTPFKTGIDLIAKGFEIAKSSIEKTWDGIKRAAAVPINFVLDTVWNNGLRSFWNDLVTELGLKDMKLAKAPLVKFATGGVLPGYTPGRDVHQFYSPTGGRLALSGGEAIMRPEFTRLVGGKSGVDALNAAARSGVLGFANGGVWGEIGNFAGDVWDNIANAARVAGEFLADPAGAIQKHVIDGIIRPLLGGQNFFGKTIGQLPINLVKNLAKSFGGATGKGTAGMGWKAMQDIVLANIKGARITSGYRSPVGNAAVGGAKGSYHMQGRAIDIVPASMATFNAVRRLFPNAAELIYTPAGAAQLRNGKPFAGWSSKVKAQHYNHVHLAMANGGVMPQLYDQGGWLPHGGIAVNQSGKPEPILTNDQWRMLGKGGLQAGDRIVIEVEGTPLTGTVKRVLDAEFASSSPEAMASEFPSR